MTSSRRQFLAATGALLVGGWSTTRLAAAASPAVAFLDKSELIYLSPFLSNGSESTCHAEVWFVHHEQEIYVVTKSNAWRTEALRRGLRRAAIWIGEFGAWKRAKNQYRSAPYLVIEGQIESDSVVHKKVLDVYAGKYAKEWGSWGPRFRDGLADGSRVMLRYSIVS